MRWGNRSRGLDKKGQKKRWGARPNYWRRGDPIIHSGDWRKLYRKKGGLGKREKVVHGGVQLVVSHWELNWTIKKRGDLMYIGGGGQVSKGWCPPDIHQWNRDGEFEVEV